MTYNEHIAFVFGLLTLAALMTAAGLDRLFDMLEEARLERDAGERWAYRTAVRDWETYGKGRIIESYRLLAGCHPAPETLSRERDRFVIRKMRQLGCRV